MQENINITSNEVINTVPTVENVEITKENSTAETKKEDQEVIEKLPKRAIRLEDGTLITNLKITYKNLFDFQNNYDGSKDLMEALVKKQTFEHEVMVQLIYVGYLGTNPTNKMEYFDFIDSLPFDYKRDMSLFQELTGLKADSKN